MSEVQLDYRDGKVVDAEKPPRDSTLVFTPTTGLRIDPAVRNASGINVSSYKTFFSATTPAFPDIPTLFVAESAAEYGVALEALMDPELYHLEMQPLTVSWEDESGGRRQHTWDQRWTFRDGRRRLVYVKSARSFRKPETQALLCDIVRATPRSAANDYIVVNADQYHKVRVQNLGRMFAAVDDPDPLADQLVWETAQRLRNLWRLRELCQSVELPTVRAMRACFRLIGWGKLRVNLDQVLCATSLVRIAG